MSTDFQQTRQRLEGKIEELIALLDIIDDDPDLEDSGDDEPSLGSSGMVDQSGAVQHDLEQDEDSEHSLGWPNPMGLRVHVPEEAAQFMGDQIDGWDA
jgi:hypothetical protein